MDAAGTEKERARALATVVTFSFGYHLKIPLDRLST